MQNLIFRKKYLWKFQKSSGNLPPGSESKGVTEINGTEHELSFHPHFVYEGLTSLDYGCIDRERCALNNTEFLQGK